MCLRKGARWREKVARKEGVREKVSEKRWQEKGVREKVSEKRCPRKGVREKVARKGGDRKGEIQEKVVGKGFKRLQLQPFETVTFNKGVAGKACRKSVKGGLKSSSGEGKRLLRKKCPMEFAFAH